MKNVLVVCCHADKKDHSKKKSKKKNIQKKPFTKKQKKSKKKSKKKFFFKKKKTFKKTFSQNLKKNSKNLFKNIGDIMTVRALFRCVLSQATCALGCRGCVNVCQTRMTKSNQSDTRETYQPHRLTQTSLWCQSEGEYCDEIPTPPFGHMSSLRHVYDSAPWPTNTLWFPAGSKSFHEGF